MATPTIILRTSAGRLGQASISGGKIRIGSEQIARLATRCGTPGDGVTSCFSGQTGGIVEGSTPFARLECKSRRTISLAASHPEKRSSAICRLARPIRQACITGIRWRNAAIMRASTWTSGKCGPAMSGDVGRNFISMRNRIPRDLRIGGKSWRAPMVTDGDTFAHRATAQPPFIRDSYWPLPCTHGRFADANAPPPHRLLLPLQLRLGFAVAPSR